VSAGVCVFVGGCDVMCVVQRWTGGADGAELSRILWRSCGFAAHIPL